MANRKHDFVSLFSEILMTKQCNTFHKWDPNVTQLGQLVYMPMTPSMDM